MIGFSLLIKRAFWGGVLAAPAGFLIAAGFSATAGLSFIGIGGFIALFGIGRSALVSGGSLVGVALLLGAISLLPDPFYRPHERFALDDRYPPHIDATMDMAFGDLIAIGGPDFTHAAEPRIVHFQTDAAGFRNNRGLAADDVIIIGDSFVAGHSGDQKDLLAGKLSSALGQPVYAYGFPGDFAAYARRLKKLGRPAWIFAFEGNDFVDTCSVDSSARPLSKTWATDLRRAVPIFAISRSYTIRARTHFRSLVKSIRNPERPPPPSPVRELKIGDQSVLVFGSYDDSTQRTTYRLPECAYESLQAVAPLVKGIFFIPTKSRLYDGLFDGTTPLPLPHANWQALVDVGAAVDVPVHDLTSAMRAEALNAYARDGSMLFWRDDTHWNGKGAKAAAIAAARIIKGAP